MKIDPTETINELICAIAYITDIEGNKNYYHNWRTTILSASIAKHAVSKKKLRKIFYANLFFDIAGVGLDHHIIHYLKRSDKVSRDSLLPHPIISAQLISNIPQMTEAAKLILDHHEWINGEGYPRAKIGSSIPWGAQVIRLADSIDIAWQRDHNISLKELRDQISLTIDKEYPNRLARHAFGVLKQNRLFHRIVKKAAIAKLFQEIRKTVGSIHIPAKIDPIGKTLDVIAQIIDMKLPYTSGHSSRVSRYAMTCALAMNLNHDDITLIKWAGLIHDIGKVSVSRKILDKPRKLTKKEFNLVKKHTLMTHKILNAIPSLKDIVPIASSHHESFDGAGYPRGLKGENIPLGARILTICDAFDAMTSTRPYRARLAPKVAYREIENLSGKQFDPGIVKYAIPLFKTLAL